MAQTRIDATLTDTVIQNIVVRGNERIESETVRSYMSIDTGDRYSSAEMDRTLKTLFATGLFADVKFSIEGGTIYVDVVENPIINRVLFEGNKAIKEDDFAKEVQLRPRIVYTPARVQADLQRMIELYRRKGRYGATIIPKVIKLPQNRVDLVFEISEGPKTGIGKISILGNRAFSERKLQKIIVTDQSRWWNILTSNDNYDPDRVIYDKEQIRKFYESHGYADFRVASTSAELSPDRKSFYITHVLDEGPQYRVGEIKVETALDELNSEALIRLVRFKKGQVYNADNIEKTIESLTFVAGSAGFAFVDIRPRIERDRENNLINLTFRVDEGPRVYVERINVTGNTRTLERVIRREFLVSEGDSYNKIKLDRSKRRVNALGFFEEVELEEEPGSTRDQTVVSLKVKEKPTGEFSFGVGFSSQDRVAGDLSISERNLLGRGQFLRLRIQGSNRRQQIDISFTEPYLFGRSLVGGFDLFRTLTDYEKEAGYRLESTGLSLRTGFPINESARISLRYTFKADDIQVNSLLCPQGPATPSYICQDVGTRTTSTAGYTFYIDKRNDPVKPSKGWDFRLNQDFAGVGGDVNYLRSENIMNWYRRLYFNNVIASATLKTGYIATFKDDGLRLSDRFRKGGQTFRGFEQSGIGPRVTSFYGGKDGNGNNIFIPTKTGNSLGGRFYSIGTLEVSFPTGLPEEYGVLASVFTEFGTVGVLEDEDLQNFAFPEVISDDLSLRASAGVSIFWDSPFGPIRLDFSKILAQEDYDQTESFRFSAGTRF
ncbi:MAG: outer membrane protein assembly factor BamA [Alphaproteobacteria bacterium]|nr:MAG: outer membrane protein assembly factor BamA [Alphaproteobacteria bacterium]